MNYYENKKKRSRGMSVYIILALCLVAIGVAAKTVLNSITPNDGTSSAPVEDISSSDDVNNIISDITYSDPEIDTEIDADTQTDTDTHINTDTIVSEPQDATQSSVVAGTTEQDIKKTPVANYFVLPITGNIIKNFSADELQYSATFNDMRLHTAIDIAAPAGTAVKAAGDGVVKSVETDSLLGTVVTIDHGNSVIAYYCGLSGEPSVKPEQEVLSGTVIGSLGTVPCECLDESHLHFAMTKDSEYVSPLKIMGMEAE